MQSSGAPSGSAPSGGAAPPPSQSGGSAPSKQGGNVIRPTQPSFHVPRGAAAVANIAMPRPASLATVRSTPTGSLVGIRGSSRAPSPASQTQQQQTPRTRPVGSPAGSRPITPQRVDTPRPSVNPTLDKTAGKSPIPVPQGPGRSTPLVSSQNRIATPSAQPGQPVQIVTQAVTQAVTQPQPTMQVITQTGQVAGASLSQAGIQSTLSTVVTSTPGNRTRPVSQGTQAGPITTLPTNPPAVVLAAPARLASPGLIGVQTGPTRLAVATALPASGARIVSPTGRMPQGRTVTYTSSHQMLQTARLPPAPVRLGPAGRGVVSLHPVLGVAPLKPAPSVNQGSVPTTSISTQSVGQSTNQVSTQTSTMPTAQAPQSSTLPSLQPAPLRTLPAQSKVMASAVVTVAAVGAGPLRSVVAAVPPGTTSTSTLTPVSSISSSPAPTPAVSKTGTSYPQTLTTVAARPVAVAGQPVRPAQGQPSVYIQATHRSSPGPTIDRSGTFPIQSAYFYEAQPGAYQVANVSGRPYTGGPPYIVQATAARPVGASPQQVHGIVATSVPGTTPGSAAAGSSSNVPVVTSVVSTVPPGSGVVNTGNVGSSVTTGQPPRFNSIMVLDPSRTALPIHAVVPAEGGATGTTYIAADGSLLPVQALPVSAASSQAGPLSSQSTPAASQASSQTSSQDTSQSTQTQTQIVTQVGSVVSQAVTSSTTGHLSMIQMVPTPVHIQMHPQGQAQLANSISQAQIHHSGSQTVTTSNVPIHTSHPSLSSHQSSQTQTHPISLSMSHQVLSHPVTISHTLPHVQSHAQTNTQGLISHSSLHPTSHTHAPHSSQAQTPTTPNKPNASPRPSILRKRDNDGSPLKAQKNLTPLLQSMGSSNPSISISTSHPTSTGPASPPSPPKRPDSGGPQSSGSTTISATSSPGQESPTPGNQPPPSAASITAGLHAAGLHGTEMSPRKKPRKQQLTGNELQEHKMSDEEMEFMAEDNGDDFPLNQQPQEQQQLHQQVLQQQQQQQAALPPPPPAPREFTLKRPNISLLSSYRYSWKSRNNHFLRHCDVRPKDERRPSVGDLASQRHIYQRLNGWKVHHLTTQMEDLADVESQVCQQLEAMLGVMERKAEQDEDKDVNRVNELIKGNMQRSRVIADQLTEAKATVMKIFDHKPHVSDIIHRSSGKRTFKKREKS